MIAGLRRFAAVSAVLVSSLAAQAQAGSASDQLDELDRQEFRRHLAQAYRCIDTRDVACINRALKDANGFATSAADRSAIQQALATAQQKLAESSADERDIRDRAARERSAMQSRADQAAEESEAQRRQIIRDNERQVAANARRDGSRAESGSPIAQGLNDGLRQFQRDSAPIARIHDQTLQNIQRAQSEPKARQVQTAPRSSPQPTVRSAADQGAPRPAAAPATVAAANARGSSNADGPMESRRAPEWGPVRMEAMAICQQGGKGGVKWGCHGPLDNDVLVEDELDQALARQRCAGAQRMSMGVTLNGKRWETFRCNRGLNGGDYDIGQRHGLAAIQRQFICPKNISIGAYCTTLYDGQDKR